MPVLLMILGITAIISLLLYLLQHYELKQIIRQLQSLSGQDSNRLLHTETGNPLCAALINQINLLLQDMHHSRIDYQQKKHHLEQMITNISHDLRTPLTSAMGYIHIICHSNLSEEEKERELYIVEQRLLRLEELIHSFFELSKIISGSKEPELAQINLVQALQESIAHYYDDFCAQNRAITFHCPMQKLMLYSNQSMLMRIFDNLISNALKHGIGNLSITVKTVNESSRIEFENTLIDSVIDTSRVFDEFYTTDISRTSGNTGLGLAIAKQFTQMLGGTIQASYNENIFMIMVTFSKQI